MSTLFLEGFGQLSPETYLIDSEEEDLYSVFLAHATLMGWCDTSTRRGPLLWGMEEAELTAGTDATRISSLESTSDLNRKLLRRVNGSSLVDG